MHVFKDRKTEFELLPEGDYSFEVVGVDKAISTSGKTNGCDKIELKLLFDGRANVLESLTLPEDAEGQPVVKDPKICDFLLARLDTFFATTGLVTKVGDSVDPRDESIYLGLRGWAKLKQEPGTKDPKKIFNRVNFYITNRPKMARNAPAREMTPVEAKPEDEYGF